MTKTALILMAHGSRLVTANNEIISLTQKLQPKIGEQYDAVEYAFLEFAQPDLISVVEKLLSNQVKQFKILPYFLSSGLHVSQDIPNLIDEIKLKYPEINFSIMPPISELLDIANLLAEQL